MELFSPAPELAMYYVYVLQSAVTKEIYIGFTKDLKKRLNEHNTDKSKSTKGKGPWVLIYSEMYKNKEDAKTREQRLKYYGKALNQLKKRISKRTENGVSLDVLKRIVKEEAERAGEKNPREFPPHVGCRSTVIRHFD